MDADLRPPRADDSVGELAKEASTLTSTLVRDEVDLAKIELREDIREAVAGVGLFSAAGAATGLAVLLASMAAGFGIGAAIGEGWTWLGFVIVAVVYLLAAGVAALVGRRHVEEAQPPLPRSTRQAQRTVRTLKEARK